ncbi:MAG: hypothetical protein RL521_1233 [Bacteroidota bacterium]
MEISTIIILALVGIFAGIISGFVGIGGGVIIVPALMYFLGYNQLQGQGVSLMVLAMPVGIFAVINYYKAGNIQFLPAFIIAIGFVFGAYFGSKWALGIDMKKVKIAFGILMFVMSIKMLLDAQKMPSNSSSNSESNSKIQP